MTNEFSRRSVLIGAGAAIGTFVIGRTSALAQSTKTLKIGFVSPISGPLGALAKPMVMYLKKPVKHWLAVLRLTALAIPWKLSTGIPSLIPPVPGSSRAT